VVDSSGDVYSAGYQRGTGSYTYGTGVSVAGTAVSGVVIVKYDSIGNALWAKSVIEGTGISEFNSVAVDSSGNIYAVGHQNGTESYTYGTGVSVAGSYSSQNVVMVKYDSSGAVFGAKSVTSGTKLSIFHSVTTDASGNVYAAGEQYQSGIYSYGDGVNVAGTSSTFSNVVLVKYGIP